MQLSVNGLSRDHIISSTCRPTRNNSDAYYQHGLTTDALPATLCRLYIRECRIR